MKKSLLAMLLAVVLVAPVFAGENKFDIVGKVGLSVNPKAESNIDTSDYEVGKNANNSVSIALEGLYKFDEKISAGLGISYMFAANFDTNMDTYFYAIAASLGGDKKMSIGFTNIYATIKPKLSDSIYAIAQLGYGIPNFKFDNDYNVYFDVAGGGIYAGLGAGIEYKSVIFEVLYTINNAKFKSKYTNYPDSVESAFRYSAISFNLGYKFAI